MTMTRSSKLAAALIFTLVCSLYAGIQSIQAAADDVSGGWAFVMETPGGTRNSNATFKVDGKTVTGTWGEKTEVRGTFADNVLELSFPIESEGGGAGTLGINAKLANNELTGTWSFQEYSGTLKATRAAKK